MSYEIHPETPVGGVGLESLFGPGYKERQQGIADRCRELDLPFQPAEVLSNSRLAVEAAEFARDAGAFGAFHRACLTAYFGSGLDIGDMAVLRELAGQVQLDATALEEALTTGRYSRRRTAAEEEARRLRITAVPTFIFDESARVVGAYPLDHFRRLLQAAGPSR